MSEHIDDPELDRHLAVDLAALHADLDQVLDLDAGLADAVLPGRVQTYTDDLDQVLDLDAGLSAILPTGQPPDATTRCNSTIAPPGDPGTGPATAETREVAELLRFAHALASMPAAARLHARLWLPRPALSTIRMLVGMGRSTREDLRTRADGLAHDLARADNHDASDLGLARARVRHLVRDLDHALGHARDLASILTLARIFARALDLALGYSRDLTRARALDHARTLARDLAGDLEGALDLDRALDRISVRRGTPSQQKSEFVRAVAADRAAEDLREEDLLEAVEIMDRVVSDVVGADLRNDDLTGIPLEGVRWSSTTRWPPAWRDRVRHRSVRIGPDLWEVDRGGIDTDHLIKTT